VAAVRPVAVVDPAVLDEASAVYREAFAPGRLPGR
jgi:hypothetical protein